MQTSGDPVELIRSSLAGPSPQEGPAIGELRSLSRSDLADLFGTSEEELTELCDAEIRRADLRYRVLNQAERDQILLEILKSLFSEQLPKAGKERQSAWENGWRQNLNEFVASGFDVDRLIPKYFKKNIAVRLNNEYVLPVQPDFVFAYANIYRTWLFKKYFRDIQSIHEFGCGPAYHLVRLAGLFPEKTLVGLDWAPASQEIISHLAGQLRLRIKGERFDFFAPTRSYNFGCSSGVLTYGALEQVGSNFRPFLEFLLEAKPSICVNVEGLHEFYDPDNLVSYLALQYHRKRNYLSGYLTALQSLEREGRIEILGSHHHRFGNRFDDSFSYVVWRPQ